MTAGPTPLLDVIDEVGATYAEDLPLVLCSRVVHEHRRSLDVHKLDQEAFMLTELLLATPAHVCLPVLTDVTPASENTWAEFDLGKGHRIGYFVNRQDAIRNGALDIFEFECDDDLFDVTVLEVMMARTGRAPARQYPDWNKIVRGKWAEDAYADEEWRQRAGTMMGLKPIPGMRMSQDAIVQHKAIIDEYLRGLAALVVIQSGLAKPRGRRKLGLFPR